MEAQELLKSQREKAAARNRRYREKRMKAGERPITIWIPEAEYQYGKKHGLVSCGVWWAKDEEDVKITKSEIVVYVGEKIEIVKCE